MVIAVDILNKHWWSSFMSSHTARTVWNVSLSDLCSTPLTWNPFKYAAYLSDFLYLVHFHFEVCTIFIFVPKSISG